ncbi:MAG: hypothetical protein J3K34DRAFT_410444 [Monoraphidium minutum]|nr:MAG: hypothetical protein J3K34DRAFT_410444 [Monoraphidium minutum]
MARGGQRLVALFSEQQGAEVGAAKGLQLSRWCQCSLQWRGRHTQRKRIPAHRCCGGALPGLHPRPQMPAPAHRACGAHPPDQELYNEYAALRRKAGARLEALQRDRRAQLRPGAALVPPEWRTLVLAAPKVLYKVVAASGGRFVSVFDGSVVYEPQRWVHARHGGGCGEALWPPLWSCMFCFETPQQALGASFPAGSKHARGARVLLRVQARGHAYAAPGGRWAVGGLFVERVLRYCPVGPRDAYLQPASMGEGEAAEEERYSEGSGSG